MAAFSISGLTSIFAGAFRAVIGLGVAFEIGKLCAVAWLGHRNGARSLHLALTGLMGILMVLNSIGVYGFLSGADVEHALAGDVTVSSKTAAVVARLDAKQADLDDIKGLSPSSTRPRRSPPRGTPRPRPSATRDRRARPSSMSADRGQRTPDRGGKGGL